MKLILAILVLIGSVFAQNTTYKDGTECNCDSIQISNSLGYSWAETPYIDGKAHGISKWYYELGALMWEYTYISGELNGVAKLYYESGELHVIEMHNNNHVIHIAEYNKDGSLVK